MRRFLSVLIAAGVVAGASLFSFGTASALGGESLACIIAPSRSTTPSPRCATRIPSPGGYSVEYVVRNEIGSYTFAWTLPPGGQLASGCTSTADFCTISVAETAGDRDLVATVVLTQGGAQLRLSSDAFIPAGCGNALC